MPSASFLTFSTFCGSTWWLKGGGEGEGKGKGGVSGRRAERTGR
jgi:hypothetical protein